ncbi:MULTISPECIES: hypothetical protein [unclassified Rathayibacter]|jgi:hypothetical protein|uniref:hypothetical protein n=1 Tax=unclassified Rathayibacter TaxID=2609250 RepID=UPI000CE906F6|nr:MULTISPECIES: hypothetical protein [unclassified Rathayibacter]PPF50134.1 hypothetical protein C5E14_02250 [Rathayibacter sp. AY1A1]PPH01434.1 hypothetical protein C5C32_05860 [Rathayibacter sp. AY1G9]
MLIRPLWTRSVRTRTFLRRWMPTKILLDKLRTRRGLKWGVPAMGLGVVYLLIAAVSITLINDGWSQGLYIVFAVCLWNALKFLLFGPIGLLLLARARVHEHRAKRDLQRSSADAMAA